MKLFFTPELGGAYKSNTQKVRTMSEDWLRRSVFCPNCGLLNLGKYPNNKPAADYYCERCQEDYELKSQGKSFGSTVVDGAFHTMIGRLRAERNPNFFLLSYDPVKLEVVNLFVVPKHFVTPNIIEKRRPLALTARRAGWMGCNILLSRVPEAGRVFYVRDRKVTPQKTVLLRWQQTLFLREHFAFNEKGWILDVMRCIDKINKPVFRLDDVYAFENELRSLHINNRHVKDKIRQQLQLLRDKGYVDFISRGYYRLNRI